MSTTSAPVVTQPSQDAPAVSSPVATLPAVVATSSPIADHHAIAAMTAGAPSTNLSRGGEGYATGRLLLFKERKGKKKAAKLSISIRAIW